MPTANSEAVSPSQIWPAPKHKPRTVTNQSVAAVVTPSTRLSRRIMAPAPMKPIPVRIPNGKRIGSSVMKESSRGPAVASKALLRIMAMEAASETSMVVLKPAGRPCSPRFSPITSPATNVHNSLTPISDHASRIGILITYGTSMLPAEHCVRALAGSIIRAYSLFSSAVPVRYVGIVAGKFGVLGNHAEFLLAFEHLLAIRMPAVVELPLVFI